MPVEPRDPKQMGELVRRARQNAGMTMEQLVKRSGYSLSTIKNIEHGKPGIKRDTLEAIFIALGIDSVMDNELDRNSDWVLWIMQEQQLFVRPNEVTEILNRQYGMIQYSDYNISPKSMQLRQFHFSQFEYSKSLDRIRAAIVNMGKIIASELKYRQVDVISLTCGHGWHEFDLVNKIIDNGDFFVRVFLVHPSYHLLQEGLRIFASKLHNPSNITIRPIIGSYQSIGSLRLFSPELMNARVRLFCLFAVFANEDNDDLLMRALSKLFLPGDFLLIDIYIPQWDYFDEKQVLARDPRLNGELSTYIVNGSQSYMEMTFKEHLLLPCEIGWSYQFRSNNSIHNRHSLARDSVCEYYVEAIASLDDGTSAPRQISAIRFNRHHHEMVINRFHQLGWAFITKTITERETNQPAAAACMLFRKI